MRKDAGTRRQVVSHNDQPASTRPLRLIVLPCASSERAGTDPASLLPANTKAAP